MLNQIKQILPDTWTWTRRTFGMEGARWRKLKIGQTVCFGAMEQPELNTTRFIINSIKEYEFSQAGFSAYSLSIDNKHICWLIVAEVEGTSPYLAISRKLSQHDLENLLADEDLLTLSHSSRMKNLYLREQTPGLRDWITMRYDRRIEGIRGKQREHDAERVFEYELYVNENNDRAIEVERFLDGHMEVYATIYRPISDVLDIIDPPRPVVAAPKARAEVKPAPSAPPAQKAPLPIASQKDVEETRQSIHQTLPLAQPAKAASIPTQTGRLECDISTAWRLIDEAMRGGMRLSDVVRKVLGLPVKTSELISFEFSLTGDDYVLLGKRYGIDPKNQSAIRARMVQELEAFAGK